MFSRLSGGQLHDWQNTVAKNKENALRHYNKPLGTSQLCEYYLIFRDAYAYVLAF